MFCRPDSHRNAHNRALRVSESRARVLIERAPFRNKRARLDISALKSYEPTLISAAHFRFAPAHNLCARAYSQTALLRHSASSAGKYQKADSRDQKWEGGNQRTEDERGKR